MDELQAQWDLGSDDLLLGDDEDVVRYEAEVKLASTHGERSLDQEKLRALIDSGANIGLCGMDFAHMLEDIADIDAIPLGIALGKKDGERITKRGYLPLPLNCGRIIRVPMHIHPSANDTIISPEAIMYSTD